MSKQLEDMTKEDLIDLVNKLKKRKKYGLVWEEKLEKVVEDCKKKLQLLQQKLLQES